MTSRYVRDEILIQALDLASCPTLDRHDRPGGVIEPNAHCIKWLQNCLDRFHRKYPFASDLQEVNVILQAGNPDVVLQDDTSKFLPDDFIIDVRHGIEVTTNGQGYRLTRKDYQRWLNYKIQVQNASTNRPFIYNNTGKKLRVLPLLTESQSGILHYYGLPPTLDPEDSVTFPDEFVIIEFVRIKAREWINALEAGTADIYLAKQLAGLRASGLLNEPEYEDGIPIENNQIIPDNTVANRNAWMGQIGL